MAAICVRDSNDDAVREFVDHLLVAISKPPGTRLKWTTMNHYERRVAADRMSLLPVRLIYVTVPKANLGASYITANTGGFYNFVGRMILERVSWLARDANATAHVTFEKVKGFPEKNTLDYFSLLRAQRTSPVAWDHLSQNIRIDSPANIRGLRTADLAAGILDAAMRRDPGTGLVEPCYFQSIASRLFRSKQGVCLGYGVKLLGPAGQLEMLPWWPPK